MDEVPVSFDLPSKFTITERGSSDVKITTTGNEKCNFTVTLAVTADGEKLPVYIIFKRKIIPKGNFPTNIIVSANEKGWMSSAEMILWLEKVWRKRPQSFFNKKSILILDAAPGHKTEEIKLFCKKIQTIPAMIPGGLTSKLQPLDISVNKSFKSKLKNLWEEWMLTGYKEYTKKGAMKRAGYEEIVGWIASAWDSVTDNTIKNGFKKTGIMFYPEEDTVSEISSDEESEDIEQDAAEKLAICDILVAGFRQIEEEEEDQE